MCDRTTLREPSRRTPLLCLALALACGPPPQPLDVYPAPIGGRPPGAHFVRTPAGAVSVRDGGLLVERLDLEIHTHLGAIRVGQTWSGATRTWHDWLALRYDGETLVDEHGTRISADGFDGSRWVRVDAETIRTRGGRLHRFEGGMLARIESPFPDGASLELERDAEGRLVRVVQQRGLEDVVLEVRHEPWGEALESYGRTVRRITDDRGRIAEVQDPAAVEADGPTTRYGYDEEGAIVVIEDPSGVRTRVAYGSGRVVQVLREQEVHEFVYRLRRRQPVERRFALIHADPTGAVTEYRHDGAGRVTWRRDPDGAIWRAGYVGDRVAWLEDPLRGRWSFEYRGGDPVARIDPGGSVETWEPEPGAWNLSDPDTTPWRERIDVRGGVWSREFDAHGRMVSSTDPSGARHEFGYWRGQLERIRTPLGFETCFGRDFAHGLVVRIHPGCAAESYLVVRTEAGWLVRTEDGGTRIFDGSGRLREIRYPGPTSTTPLRRLFERDEAGRLVATVNPYGGRIELDRDPTGRIVSVREQLLGDFDDRGVKGPLWTEVRIERDASGREVARRRPNGERVEIERDPVGRLIRLRYLDPEGSELASVWLDRDAAGRVVRVDDSREAGPTEIERDALGRAVRVHYPHGEWIEQELDPSGDPIRMDFYGPDGVFLRRIEWAFDQAGRPIEVLENGATLVEVSYSPAEETVRFANGVAEVQRFDAMERLSELLLVDPMGNALRHYRLAYWLDGFRPTRRLMGLEDRIEPEGSVGFAYDGAGRLVVWSGEPSHWLRWDVLGNLQRQETSTRGEPMEARGIIYNRFANRILSAGTDLIENDALGRVTRIGDTEIEWEPFDRPRRIGTIELRDSTLGIPISRTVDGETTHFLFGGLAEADADLHTRVLEIGDVRIDLRDGTHEYLHRDARHNVAWGTDDGGRTVLHRRFGPFGGESVRGTSVTPRGFAGGNELGAFVQIGARILFPGAARFLSGDPLPGWNNRYTYAGGDPVNFWDPDGLDRTEVRRSWRARFIVRPITGGEIEVREEIIVDGASPVDLAPGSADEASPAARPSPGMFPEIPNYPPIPDVILPPRFGGCNAIVACPKGVAALLIALPLLTAIGRPGARRSRSGR